jgi:hypothetical protein
MIYDSLGGIYTPNILDIKTEKRHEGEGVRPVEDAEETEDSKMDMDRQDIAKNRSAQNLQYTGIESDTYNAKGDVDRKATYENVTEQHHESVDLVI